MTWLAGLDLLNAAAAALAIVGVIVVWLLLDRLGSQWFQALPEAIRDKGLVGMGWEKLQQWWR